MGSWELDVINNTLAWSDEVYRIFGLKPQEFAATYEAFLESVHPEDRRKVDDAYSGSLRNGMDTYEVEHRIVRKLTGEIRVVYEKCEHIRDASGRIVRSVGMVHDITERKEAEEALRKSEQRWSTTLSSIGDAVIAFDTAGKVTYMNAVAEELTGWRLCEATQRPVKEVFKIINEFTRKEVEDPVSKVLEKGMIVGLANHTVLIRKDGAEVPIDDSGAPIRGERGKIAGVVLVFRDISERKKAEQELWKAKNDWERTFDSVPDLIAILDDKHRIVRANQAMAEAIGELPEKCVGLNCYACVHGTSSPPDFCPHAKTLKDGKEHVAEVHENRLGGDFMVSATPLLDEKGRMVGAVHVARDITPRKQMEKKLEEYSKNLEKLVEERTKQLRDSERLAAIGATAGMVGHDIRNPLQSILGEVFLSQTAVASLPDGEGKREMLESLEMISQNIEYINKIVQDLQDFAKPLKPTLEDVDLADLVAKLHLKMVIPENIQAIAEVKPEVKTIISDSTCLNRILGNLVLNAVQAMPDGGTLTVFACKEEDEVVISVADTGVGIPDEVRDKLFTPMFTTKSKGQGFGLPVVKRMVEALNGNIAFESKPGKGTKFVMRFPSS